MHKDNLININSIIDFKNINWDDYDFGFYLNFSKIIFSENEKKYFLPKFKFILLDINMKPLSNFDLVDLKLKKIDLKKENFPNIYNEFYNFFLNEHKKNIKEINYMNTFFIYDKNKNFYTCLKLEECRQIKSFIRIGICQSSLWVYREDNNFKNSYYVNNLFIKIRFFFTYFFTNFKPSLQMSIWDNKSDYVFLYYKNLFNELSKKNSINDMTLYEEKLFGLNFVFVNNLKNIISCSEFVNKYIEKLNSKKKIKNGFFSSEIKNLLEIFYFLKKARNSLEHFTDFEEDITLKNKLDKIFIKKSLKIFFNELKNKNIVNLLENNDWDLYTFLNDQKTFPVFKEEIEYINNAGFEPKKIDKKLFSINLWNKIFFNEENQKYITYIDEIKNSINLLDNSITFSFLIRAISKSEKELVTFNFVDLQINIIKMVDELYKNIKKIINLLYNFS